MQTILSLRVGRANIRREKGGGGRNRERERVVETYNYMEVRGRHSGRRMGDIWMEEGKEEGRRREENCNKRELC